VFGAAKVTGKELLTPNKLAACLRAIVARLGIPRATPHDLRRTAGTLIQSAVLPDRPKYLLEEVGWLLSHKSADKNGVTGIYGRYQHLDEKRAMAAVLGREVARILEGGRGGCAHGGLGTVRQAIRAESSRSVDTVHRYLFRGDAT